MLAASRELHKFFHDCKDVLSRIMEKQHSMSDELGRDAGSVSALQRKHQNFLQDLLTLQSQVRYNTFIVSFLVLGHYPMYYTLQPLVTFFTIYLFSLLKN